MKSNSMPSGFDHISLQRTVDTLHDENRQLKSKNIELETELFEERNKQSQNYTLSLDVLKENIQQQTLDVKASYD